jgi:hypothetical protein
VRARRPTARVASYRDFELHALVVLLAIATVVAPIPREWVEGVYANGIFAALNRAFVSVSNAVPVAIADAEALFVIIMTIILWLNGMSGVPSWERGRTALRMGAHTIAWLAIGVVAFEVLWGFNYRRTTVAGRIVYDPAAVTDSAVAEFSERIVGMLNRDVAAAHAEKRLDLGKLAIAFLPVVGRLGDDWDVTLTQPKTTLLEPYYEAAGIGGQYAPFSFETLLNKSFLPFETPRALAHEWAHVAGFTDEGDANYIGTLACLRSDDPLIQYSGAFWTYAELPAAQRRRLKLDPRVIADFRASRIRFERHFVPQLFSIQWHVYDRYLRSNGVSGGVASYGYFLRLLVASQLDSQGLPIVRRMQSSN